MHSNETPGDELVETAEGVGNGRAQIRQVDGHKHTYVHTYVHARMHTYTYGSVIKMYTSQSGLESLTYNSCACTKPLSIKQTHTNAITQTFVLRRADLFDWVTISAVLKSKLDFKSSEKRVSSSLGAFCWLTFFGDDLELWRTEKAKREKAGKRGKEMIDNYNYN